MSGTRGDELDRVRGRTSSALAGGTLVVIAALVVGLMIVPRWVLSPVGNGAAGGSQSAIPAVPTTAASFATLAPHSEAPSAWESGPPAPTASAAASLAATTKPRPLPTELPPTPEPLGTQGYENVTIHRLYSAQQIDATHISVMVDYDFEIMGLASTMAKPMGLWEADCSDPNFQAEGDSAIEVGSHTITVVIQALGPFPPADSSGASQVECKTILAGVGGLGEVGIQWSTIGPAWLSFDSHFSISEPAAS